VNPPRVRHSAGWYNGFIFDIETDLDDDDIGLAENLRVGDGDEVAGDPADRAASTSAASVVANENAP